MKQNMVMGLNHLDYKVKFILISQRLHSLEYNKLVWLKKYIILDQTLVGPFFILIRYQHCHSIVCFYYFIIYDKTLLFWDMVKKNIIP